MLHDRKINFEDTELKCGKWSLCRHVFQRECIIRLGEASLKGEPRCLWAIRSQQGDQQMHVTARGSAVLICPRHLQRARLGSCCRSCSGGHRAEACTTASLHPCPPPHLCAVNVTTTLAKTTVRLKYKLVLTRRLTPCPYFTLSHCAWGNIWSVKAATRLIFVKRNPYVQQYSQAVQHGELRLRDLWVLS